MAKQLTVFINRYSGDNVIAKECMGSFCEGLKNLGVDFSLAYEDEYEKNSCNIAVIFGAYKKVLKTYKIRKKIFFSQELANKKVLVIERGFIKRDKYHSIGWNFINGRADFVNSDMPNDRFSKLGIAAKDWCSDGENIIVCGQVPWDVSVQHLNSEPIPRVSTRMQVGGYLKWCVNIVKEIQKYSDRKIIFRPHPFFKNKKWHKDGMPNNVIFSDASFEDDLKNAWCTVTFNSNCSVESIINGIPTFAADIGCMAWEVANKNIKNIENPNIFDRQQWLNNIAYSQWNLDEFKAGLPWLHITRNL